MAGTCAKMAGHGREKQTAEALSHGGTAPDWQALAQPEMAGIPFRL